MSFHGGKLVLGYQTTSSRLDRNRPEIADGIRIGVGQVTQRTKRAAYRQTTQVGQFAGRESGPVQHDRFGRRTVASKCWRHDHVDLGRVEIPQLEKAQGRLMRHHPYRLFIASTRPEEPSHHLAILGRREMRHPINAPTDSLPIPGANVVRVRIVRVASLMACFIVK